ncbi:hypothetical protein [Methylobacterium sp. E-066]|uniref:hypothetical protein n=1 Tax=Methylobacterium sp. E-066 TaxID=2836584 RepID=UPI001FBAD674|nr:hypothetical protein [Methylobacterium sp. E-066]MCJ2141346.1 hypothetical protein [Methylobacterium sp. E-066]
MGARVDPDRIRVSIRTARAAVLALVTLMVAPATAWAWGVPGCTNLPEYNRALGALQGMTSACDMSVERARQVIAEHDGVPVAQPPVAPPRVQARRHAGRAHHHRASRHRHAARR